MLEFLATALLLIGSILLLYKNYSAFLIISGSCVIWAIFAAQNHHWWLFIQSIVLAVVNLMIFKGWRK